MPYTQIELIQPGHVLIGYGEQEHGETLERGHAPFVVYAKMYEKVVVHEVKVDIFGVAHADIKNLLRHPEKVGYDAYFHGFRVLVCKFCDLVVSAFQKIFFLEFGTCSP